MYKVNIYYAGCLFKSIETDNISDAEKIFKNNINSIYNVMLMKGKRIVKYYRYA